MNRLRKILLMVCPAILLTDPVAAQLYGGFIPRDAHRQVNIWFGSVRDKAGSHVPNATIVLVTRQIDYVAVSDVQGRFRLELPLSVKPADVKARCSRKGFSTVRIVRRLPRGGAATPVEISCYLR